MSHTITLLFNMAKRNISKKWTKKSNVLQNMPKLGVEHITTLDRVGNAQLFFYRSLIFSVKESPVYKNNNNNNNKGLHHPPRLIRNDWERQVTSN